jgi:hypothetical protein
MRPRHASMLSLVAALAIAPAARAQHDVPVWYLDYEVTIKASHTAATTTYGSQPSSTTWTLDRVFAASAKLDMRNEGSVIGANQAAMADPDKFKNMTQAEMMQYSQDMLAAMQYTANWMPGPLDVGDGQDAMTNHMKSTSVPVRLSYQSVNTGKNLVDEMGEKFDLTTTVSGVASEGTLYPGDQYKFELNTQGKKYWLILPYTGGDLDPDAGKVTIDTVEKIRMAGSDTWQEKRSTREMESGWLPDKIKIDKTGESAMGDVPVIVGTLAGPGPITGGKTFNATFLDAGVNVPMTITFKYTLSPTSPAKKK